MKVCVVRVSDNRFATDSSSLATSAVVITPPAASGAIVGPVTTASGLALLAASNFSCIASEISRLPGARPLAKSIKTCPGRKWGMTSSTTSKMTDEGIARTTISTPSSASSILMVTSMPSIEWSGRYFLFIPSIIIDS